MPLSLNNWTTYILIRNFKYWEKSYFEYEISTLSVLNVPSKSSSYYDSSSRPCSDCNHISLITRNLLLNFQYPAVTFSIIQALVPIILKYVLVFSLLFLILSNVSLWICLDVTVIFWNDWHPVSPVTAACTSVHISEMRKDKNIR